MTTHGIQGCIEDPLCVKHGEKVAEGHMFCFPHLVACSTELGLQHVVRQWELREQGMDCICYFVGVISPLKHRLNVDCDAFVHAVKLDEGLVHVDGERSVAHEHAFRGCVKRRGEYLGTKPSIMGAAFNPMMATVLPVLNEGNHIGACLDSLIQQTYPASRHVILVLDGGSTDETAKEVEAAILRSTRADGPRIEFHLNPGRFVAEGRNLALKLLPGSVTHVLELIGHSTVKPDHIAIMVEEWNRISEIESRPLAALGCRVAAREGELGTVESWVEATLASPMGSGGGQFDTFSKAAPCKIPAFVLHARDALVTVGGWDESFISSQDSDLSMRLAAEGYALWRTPRTTVHMTKRAGLKRWWKMGHRYGFWRTKTVLRHPKRISLREYLPWFGLLLTLALFGLDSPWWTVLIGAYGCVLVAEAVRMVLRFKRPSLLVGVPMCLFMLHTSFSIGLIDGFLRRGRAATDR